MAESVKKEPEKVVKTTNGNIYTAVNPKQFKEWFTDVKPGYKELSEGMAVELDESDATVKSWLSNKIIKKEN